MSNLNINKTTDNLDVATPQPPHVWSVQHKPVARVTWDVVVARYGMGLLAAGAAWWASPEWAHTYIVGAGCAIGTLAAAKHVLTDWIAGIPVRTYHNNVTADRVVSMVGTAAIEDARRELPASLSSYNPSAPPAPKALPSGGETVDSPEVTVLPSVGPLPSSEWLAWLDEQPHAIFAAATGRGKSTIAKYGLSPRILSGESIFVIDAHSNGWFDLPGVGGGENWQVIEAAMMAVYAEYKTRLQYREQYKRETGEELPHDHFPRLTVVFDEANNAQDAFTRLYSGSRRRFDPWPLFAQCLGSGARKVGISVWLLLQSALVEDLGLSGSMRQNFTRIAMDAYTINQMAKEERDEARRKAIYAALPSIEYPATAMIQSQVFLLDRSGLDNPPTPRNSGASAWDGWDYRADRPLVTLGDDAQPAEPVRIAARAVAKAQASNTVRASVQVQPLDTYKGMVFEDDAARIGWLAFHTKLGTREIREIVGCNYNDVVAVAGDVRRRKALKEAKAR